MRRDVRRTRLLWCAVAVACAIAAGCKPAPPPVESATDAVERGPIKLSVEASPKTAMIAEPVKVRITVDAPSDYVIELPDEKSFGELTVAAAPPPGVPLALPDGGLRWQREFSLESYTAGPLEIPPTVIKYAKKGDGAATTKPDSELATGSLKVEIRSALTSQDAITKPRDITSLLGVPNRPLTRTEITLFVIAVVTAIVAALVIYRWVMARLLRPAPPVAPEVWALRELSALERDDLFAAGRVREFYYRLSEVVRAYIERKFALAAPEMTTEEFLARLSRDAGALPYDAARLRVFMESCDLVKYAALTPTREDGAGNLGAARAFIDATAAAYAAHEAARARAAELAAASASPSGAASASPRVALPPLPPDQPGDKAA